MSQSLNSPLGQFFHYARVLRSFTGNFKEPLVAVVPDRTCARAHRHYHDPSLIFDTYSRPGCTTYRNQRTEVSTLG